MPINAISNVSNVNFRGAKAVTENGAEYYKTNNGLKVGSALGGVELISNIIGKSYLGGFILAGMHVGIGSFIDYKRNKHAAEAADYIKQVGLKKALETRDDIELNANQKPYYRSKDGMKYGTTIGAIIGALIGFFPGLLLSIGGASVLKGKQKGVAAGAGVLFFGLSTGISALGGLLLGKITDHYTNKAAAKNA